MGGSRREYSIIPGKKIRDLCYKVRKCVIKEIPTYLGTQKYKIRKTSRKFV